MTQMKKNLERIYRELSTGRISREEAFASIKALKATGSGDDVGMLMAVPAWHASVVDSPDTTVWAERHVVVCELPGVTAEMLGPLVAGSRSGSVRCCRASPRVRCCCSRGRRRPDSRCSPGLSALLKSATLENPLFCGQLVVSRRDVADVGAGAAAGAGAEARIGAGDPLRSRDASQASVGNDELRDAGASRVQGTRRLSDYRRSGWIGVCSRRRSSNRPVTRT